MSSDSGRSSSDMPNGMSAAGARVAESAPPRGGAYNGGNQLLRLNKESARKNGKDQSASAIKAAKAAAVARFEKGSGSKSVPEKKTMSNAKAGAFRLEPKLLVQIHDLMVKARVLEERLIRMYKQIDGYFWIGGPGEEAFQIPLALQIKKGQGLDYDYMHLHYRSSPIMTALGMDPIDAIRQMKNIASRPVLRRPQLRQPFLAQGVERGAGHFDDRNSVSHSHRHGHRPAPARRHGHHDRQRRRRRHGRRRFCLVPGLVESPGLSSFRSS